MKLFALIFSLGTITNIMGQVTPQKVELKPNNSFIISGDLSEGKMLEDLSWAWNSSVACFPATQKTGFNGNHVLYEAILPKRSILSLTLKPKNRKDKMSIYGYQVGINANSVVPNLASCVSCEADNNQGNKRADNTREIKLNATTNQYKVYFAIVGENKLTEGAFTIEVKLDGGEEEIVEDLEMVPYMFNLLESGKTVYMDEEYCNLSKGQKLNNLSWAWSSSNACFPATQQKSFKGNHVLYETETPKRSEIEVTLTPKDPNKVINLYGYQIGKNSNYIVPNLPRCVTCEADNNQSGKSTSNVRKIKFNAINNPYKVIIGVAGEEGVTEGDYTLSIKLIGGESNVKEQETVIVKNAHAPEKGNTATYTNDIKNGVLIHDLSWAWNSSNACFPGTQKESYEGKHILFQTEMNSYSTMTVTLIPKNKKDELSLYGYQIGKTSNYTVPNLPSCVSCEADNNASGRAKDNKRTIKFMAIRNPYKVIIGVAGAKGITEGDFDIKIKVEER